MYNISDAQYQLVYNALSFTFACMAASTLFFWMRLPSISEKFKSALVITGLVTFIAAYHYYRIFNSWVAAYTYGAASPDKNGNMFVNDPTLSGIPFNDAYRYMDWLLTVPLLLVEIVLVMNLTPDEASRKSWTLGSAAALMIVLGYPGELILGDDLSKRWVWWALAMVPFCYIVYTLMVGLKDATNSEADETVRSKIRTAQLATVISWCTYPIVFILPMCGLKGASAVVGIQVGYCISDVIAKCGVGVIIYTVTAAKSAAMKDSLLAN